MTWLICTGRWSHGRRSTPAPGCWRRWPGPRSGRYLASGSRCGRISTSPRKRPAEGRPMGPPASGWVRCWTGSGWPAGSLRVPLDSLNRHVFVCGATGGGKSQTVRAPAGGGQPGRGAVAGGRAGQGRVPADGGAAGRIGGRGGADPAGRGGRGGGRAEPAGAGRRRPRAAVPAADPRRSGPGAVPGRVPVRGAVPPGAQRRADQGVRRRGMGPGPGRAAHARPDPRLSRGWPTCSGRPSRWCRASATARRSAPTCSASSRSGWPACGWAPPDGSWTAATRSTSAGCCAGTWCWRSRTSATTGTRPS